MLRLSSFTKCFRNYETLTQDLKLALEKQDVLADDGDLRSSEKWELFMKRKLLNRLEAAYRIVSDPEVRKLLFI